MKTFKLATALATVLLGLGITGQASAYTLQYTDLDGEFFTLDSDNPEQAQYFSSTLFGDPAEYTQVYAGNPPVGNITETVNWQVDISKKLPMDFSCPYCVIEVNTHYDTEFGSSMFINVSNMDMYAATDVYFQGFDEYVVDWGIYYTAVDIGSPSDLAVSAVPVPAAVWLFGSGLLGLVGVARRKTDIAELLG